ncbi:hypothetical protein VULLAG_LOCUS12395 [Vulpes lagopus]
MCTSASVRLDICEERNQYIWIIRGCAFKKTIGKNDFLLATKVAIEDL